MSRMALLIFMGASVALAQLPTATILGTVKDATGAVVPGANLTARNVETGQTRTAITAGDGSYRFAALPVGSYEIRAEHPGFRSEVRSALTLTVGQEAVVHFTLEVGAIEQTVSVTAEAPLVNTTSGSLGGLVGEQQIADLPLNGRNYIDLVLLQPGIQRHQNKNQGGAQIGVWFSSNGAPPRSNNLLLDGASMVNLYGASSSSATQTTLGIEGIREWRVITNSFSAEYGMTMGSQMVIVSKGGTNSFHGSLLEFLRNSALDARNFFDRRTPTTPRRVPAFTRNNFGGAFGGPIKKDKTFFYGVYEALRERLGRTIVSNVIPASAKVDGGLVPQIAPVIKPFLPLFPDPNLPNNQYTFAFSQPTTVNYGQMRVDQTMAATDTAFVRYTIDSGEQTLPVDYPQFVQAGAGRMQFATLSENHVFSPSLLNTFRFSYSRTNVGQGTPPSGLLGPQFSFLPGLEVGGLNIGGVTAWGPPGATPLLAKQNLFTWSDDLFYTRGRHALKFGALLNRYQTYTLRATTWRGQINFANPTSFLLGQPSSYTVGLLPGSIADRTYHFSTLGLYAQDDLRVRSNLTFNLGLRYEFNTTYQETLGHGASFRDILHDAAPTVGPPFKNPSLRNLSPRFGFAWDVRGNGRTAVRGGFGLLYDIATLGSALFMGSLSPPFSSSATVAIPATNPAPLVLPLFFPPSAFGKGLFGVDYNLRQPHMLQYNLTVERQLPWEMVATLAYGGSRGIHLMQTTEGNPTVPQVLPDGRKFWTGADPRINPNWNTFLLETARGDSWYNSLQFGLLKRLGKGLQFQSSFTWSRLIDTNQGALGGETTTTATFPADPYDEKRERAAANFDITRSWRFNAIYRFPELGRQDGVVGNLLNGWGISGILSLQTGYSFSPSVQTNRSRSGVNGGASLPGWGANADRPDLAPGATVTGITKGVSRGCGNIPAGTSVGTPNLWFDPCAFTLQPAGFLGTAGRNILRGPGLATLDFSLTKDTPLRVLGEAGRVEFRADVFNLLNKTNFITPMGGGRGNNSASIVFAGTRDGESPLATTGLLTSTSTSSRQIQMALKVRF